MKRQSTDNKGSIGAERVRDSSSFPSDATQGAYFLFESQRRAQCNLRRVQHPPHHAFIAASLTLLLCKGEMVFDDACAERIIDGFQGISTA